jgi:hypothetical protein
VTVTFAVTPTDPGFITYTAEVSADQNDAFWPDNTALLTSTILTPAVGITSQINVGDVSSSDIVLSWTHMVENHTYEIHRNQAPYFTPDSNTLIASLPAPTDAYTDTDILATVTSAYYIIRVRNGPTTADGDELGAFVFSIIPGDNQINEGNQQAAPTPDLIAFSPAWIFALFPIVLNFGTVRPVIKRGSVTKISAWFQEGRGRHGNRPDSDG